MDINQIVEQVKGKLGDAGVDVAGILGGIGENIGGAVSGILDGLFKK